MRPQHLILLAVRWLVLATVATAQPTGEANAPRLANERMLLDEAQKKAVLATGIHSAAKLTPDGARVLYGTGRKRGEYELWSYDLEENETRRLVSGVYDSTLVMLAIEHPMISADGKKLLMFYTKSHEWYDLRSIDLATGESQRTPIRHSPVAMGWYVGKDRMLLYESPTPHVHKMNWVTSNGSSNFDAGELNRPKVAGVTAQGHLMALASWRDGPLLSIYDVIRQRVVANPPVHRKFTGLTQRELFWTSDGRYFYYPDKKPKTPENEKDLKRIIRVWDQQTQRLVAELPFGYALGPGPVPKTMVLQLFGRDAGLYLHDAATGQLSQLGNNRVIGQSAAAGKVVFTRIGATRTMNIATIEM